VQRSLQQRQGAEGPYLDFRLREGWTTFSGRENFP
jgi:hypothetical protein